MTVLGRSLIEKCLTAWLIFVTVVDFVSKRLYQNLAHNDNQVKCQMYIAIPYAREGSGL